MITIPNVPYKKMEAEEINALIVAAQKGDLAARNRVIMQHYRLIVQRAFHAARKVARLDLVEDLIHAAICGGLSRPDCVGGIVKAIELFDPSKGIAFTTYAKYWITKEFRLLLAGATSGCASPDTLQNIQKISAVRDRLEYSLERPPTVEEIQEDYRASGRKPPNAQTITRALSFEELPMDWQADGRRSAAQSWNRMALVPQEDNEIEEDLDRKLKAEGLREAIDRLPPRERELVKQSYYRDKTTSEIGSSMGFSRQRARQLLDRAHRQLEEDLASRERAVA